MGNGGVGVELALDAVPVEGRFLALLNRAGIDELLLWAGHEGLQGKRKTRLCPDKIWT
jgi:hypothetical protein